MEVGWQEKDGDRLWNDLFIGLVILALEQLLASMPKKILCHWLGNGGLRCQIVQK